jgi:hypothetical protein
MNDTNGVDVCELHPLVEPKPGLRWKTKDGRLLELCEMTDDHLRNARQLCLRRSAEHADLGLACLGGMGLQGEMALMYAGYEGEVHLDRASAAQAWAGALEAELRRRGAAIETQAQRRARKEQAGG